MTKTLEELKEYRHQYYFAHKEEKMAYSKEWSKNNPEKRKAIRDKWALTNKEYYKKYYQDNKEKLDALSIKWWKEHPEKKKETCRKWSMANPDNTNARWRKRHANKLNAPGSGITAQQAIDLKKETMGHCVYCCKEKRLTIDHVVPLTSGGHNDIDNAVPSCQSCNSSKGTKPLLMYLYYRNTVD